MLFQVGESSHAGIFIVLEGQLGVFLPEGDQLRHTNTLRTGESVGDLDVLDGESSLADKLVVRRSYESRLS